MLVRMGATSIQANRSMQTRQQRQAIDSLEMASTHRELRKPRRLLSSDAPLNALRATSPHSMDKYFSRQRTAYRQ